jgi:putative spermidine/putrescine transport system ATP-binding protein
MIKLESATVRYGSAIALDHVSLDVARGEFLALLGPSGSGKTSLLNVIAGIVPLSAGAILIDGKDVTRVPPHQRELGMVFQSYALMPHYTVFENVALPLRLRKLKESEIRSKVMATLDLVRLTEYIDRMPRQLSGGQQQRVSLARAIVYEPKVILMDEPLGALDKHLRQDLQTEIRRLHALLKPTVIIVTHDQEEALSLATRVAVVNGGKIVEQGSPRDVYFKPHDRFAAGFVGDANTIEGEIIALDGDIATVGLPNSHLVRGVRTQGVEVGQRVRVLFRPEAVDITAPETSDNNNWLIGHIEDHFLQGSTWKTVAVAGDQKVVVQRLARDTTRGPLDGPVRLSWSPQDTIILR